MRTSAYLLLKIAFLLAIANTGDVIAGEITVDDGSQNSRAIAANVSEYGNVWNSLAQSFTATDPFVRFGFRLFDEDSSLPNAGTSLVYRLYQGENVYTALLATRTVTMPSTLSTDARSVWGDVGFVEADFSDVALTPGSRYTVEITLPAGSLPAIGSYSGVSVWTSLLNPYTGGRFFFTANYDNSFFADQDMLFHMQPVDIELTDDVISTVAGNGIAGYSGDGGPATSARMNFPNSLAIDAGANIYFVDRANHRIRKISPGGLISSVAGTGVPGFSGDGGPATNARLNDPTDVTIDGAGNLYIADCANYRVRKISPSGTISTFAGTGAYGYGGDGGQARNATFTCVGFVEVDSHGNLFIADFNNDRIRKVSSSGVVTTIASVHLPYGMAMDSADNLYVADPYSHRIRRVTSAGMITTVAGNGTAGFSGDGSAAIAASLDYPTGLDEDSAGNLYISDAGSNRIRKISPNGIINTLAGNGTQGFSGDGGSAINARLATPWDIVVGGYGAFFISDANNQRIRQVGTITPEQGTRILLSSIQTASLSMQVAGPLLAPIKNISKILDDGNPANDGASCGKLDEFIANVEAKVASSQLSGPKGIEFILQAESLKADIDCP